MNKYKLDIEYFPIFNLVLLANSLISTLLRKYQKIIRKYISCKNHDISKIKLIIGKDVIIIYM